MAPTEDWIGPLKTGLYITEYGPWAALTRTALLPLITIKRKNNNNDNNNNSNNNDNKKL